MTVVTGHGHVLLGAGGSDVACDSEPFLKARKSRKYMGLQDDLAVVSAGRALRRAGLRPAQLAERAGLYLCVGYIPFERAHVEPVLRGSVHDGAFSMARFADTGYRSAHPLVTFRCLPNMPAYHVAANFDVRGPYMVVYPGAAQVYAALEEASLALVEGVIDVALVGGVACQRNFLVEHHFARLDPPVAPERLRDAGAFVVLETEAGAAARDARVRGRLERSRLTYVSFDPRRGLPPQVESIALDDGPEQPVDAELGPASVLHAVSAAWAGGAVKRVHHSLRSRDGMIAESVWSSS